MFTDVTIFFGTAQLVSNSMAASHIHDTNPLNIYHLFDDRRIYVYLREI